MAKSDSQTQFDAPVVWASQPSGGEPWAFSVLPREASAVLPRRGRTSVHGHINGVAFSARLEPDGQRSHWLRIDQNLIETAALSPGPACIAHFSIQPLDPEPEPQVPADLHAALQAAPEALRVWQDTSTLARVDWIHWVESAKQTKTRDKRIRDACDMLSEGKRRVCCFDPSGVYSKALSAPKPADA